jgi:hypothetical protein
MKCLRCSFENPPGFAFCGKGGQVLATSAPFNLPGADGVGVAVQVSLVP